MVLCENESIYTGYATDLIKRFNQHKVGRGAKYTRSFRPIRLLYARQYASKSLAMKAEYQIKQFSHRHKLRMTISTCNKLIEICTSQGIKLTEIGIND